jgi:TRAP transporter 4TM/12TM fusion protein
MRQLQSKKMRMIVSGWLVFITLFLFYTAFFGIYQPRIQRGIPLLFLVSITFILFPATKKSPQDRPTLLDILLAVLAILPPLYLIMNNDTLNYRLELITPITTVQLLLGILNIILVVEAIRRAVVPAMAFLAVIFFIYQAISPYLPGVFYSKEITLAKMVELQYLITNAGIYGSITAVAVTFAAIFVIFGAFLEKTKTGEFFCNIAGSLSGRSIGGPAKIAVISSGLFGSISGVAAANVYATGNFSIPMMKRIGYNKQFAGAVEAAASTGGMIMPPIMGVGAFVMSEITGISYINICIAAALGAIFYYVSIWISVHFVALRDGLRGLSKEEIIPLKQIIKDTYVLFPLVVLIYYLLKGYSPYRAASFSVLLSFAISFLSKKTMMTPLRLWQTLELAGRNSIMIVLSCACADMVVSVITYTGIGLGIAGVIGNWSQGILFLGLFLIMIVTIMLSMGLPCTPAYIISIAIGGPALRSMGVDLLSSHLFVFYFAVMSGVTPPVCIAAYCGASIAGSDPIKTGFSAWKLALSGFIIPFVFVYNPALLLKGSFQEIIIISVELLTAIIFLNGALTGYFTRRLITLEKFILFSLSLGLVILSTFSSKIDFIVVGIIIITLIVFKIYRMIQNKYKKTF